MADDALPRCSRAGTLGPLAAPQPVEAAASGRRHSRGWTLLLAAASLAACEASGQRVYTAAPFRPEASCLEAPVPLGLVEADELPASCEATCLRRAGVLHVSRICPPYPREARLETAAEPECAAALAALGNEARCEPSDSLDADDPDDAGGAGGAGGAGDAH